MNEHAPAGTGEMSVRDFDKEQRIEREISYQLRQFFPHTRSAFCDAVSAAIRINLQRGEYLNTPSDPVEEQNPTWA